MATWKSENSMLTQVGVEILNKVKAGIGSITVTRIVAGSGRVSASQLFQQKALSGATKPMTISRKGVVESGIEISVYITNNDFTEPFNLNQIGVYVSHPDYLEEQLYHISQCESTGFDVIPALEETPVTLGYSLFLEHGNSSSISITVDPQGMVSIEDFNNTLKSYTKGLQTNLTLYVDSSLGNDENSGSEDSPLATIQRAINLITTNINGRRVTIKVRSGEYDKFEINNKFNGFIEIEGQSLQDMPVIRGDCRINYITGRVKLTFLHFVSDSSNTVGVLELQTIQEIMVNQCIFDAVSKNISGVSVGTGSINLGLTGVVFRNCKHCVNTNHDSGIGGNSSVSVYACTGSNNDNGIVNSCSTVSSYYTTKEDLGATTMYVLMPTAGPTFADGILVSNAVAPATLEE